MHAVASDSDAEATSHSQRRRAVSASSPSSAVSSLIMSSARVSSTDDGTASRSFVAFVVAVVILTLLATGVVCALMLQGLSIKVASDRALYRFVYASSVLNLPTATLGKLEDSPAGVSVIDGLLRSSSVHASGRRSSNHNDIINNKRARGDGARDDIDVAPRDSSPSVSLDSALAAELLVGPRTRCVEMPHGVRHVFVAANLHESERVLPTWLRQMKRLLLLLSCCDRTEEELLRGLVTRPDAADSNDGDGGDDAGTKFHHRRASPSPLSRVFVSVFTSHCADRTNEILRDEFVAWLEEHKIPFEVRLAGAVEGGYVERPASMGRIDWLSRVRNAAMRPLIERGTSLFVVSHPSSHPTSPSPPPIDATRVLFLNDIVFTAEDMLLLLHSNHGAYDMACGLDFYFNFYDTWVSRDVFGRPFWGAPPYSAVAETADGLRNLSPVSVSCCWNGAVVARAAVFIMSTGHGDNAAAAGGGGGGGVAVNGGGVSARRLRKRLADSHANGDVANIHNGSTDGVATAANIRFRSSRNPSCAVSECLLLCRDMRLGAGASSSRRRFTNIIINPVVRVAYDSEAYFEHHGFSFVNDFFVATAWALARLNVNFLFQHHAPSSSGIGERRRVSDGLLSKPPSRMSARLSQSPGGGLGGDDDVRAADDDNCDISTLGEAASVTNIVSVEMGAFVIFGAAFHVVLIFWLCRYRWTGVLPLIWTRRFSLMLTMRHQRRRGSGQNDGGVTGGDARTAGDSSSGSRGPRGSCSNDDDLKTV